MTYVFIFITAIVSVLCFRSPAWAQKLALNPYDVVHKRQWYRIFSHAFVHADYMHLIINMFVLLSFGVYTEDLFRIYAFQGLIGSPLLSYLSLYFGGIVAASVYDLIRHKNDPNYASIGASGAVSAVIFTTIFFAPWNPIYLFALVPIPGLLFGVFYLLYCRYMGRRAGDHINHYAHLFGALYGFVFPLLMNPALFDLFWRNFWEF